MHLFRKIRSIFHDDWCSQCYTDMEVRGKRLFMLPVMVDHYVHHDDAKYFMKNLIRVSKKKDIPTGYYACGIVSYKCPNCGEALVKLTVFLPVRDQEKDEDYIYFKNGELDTFLQNSDFKDR